MLDLKLLRDDPERIEAALKQRGAAISLAPLLELDAQRRALVHETEQLRASQHAASQEIARRKKAGEDAGPLLEEMKDISERAKLLGGQVRDAAEALEAQLLALPNLPDASVPEGPDEASNRLERVWGDPPSFDFEARDHVDLGEALGIIDFERAAKIAGARFSLLRGPGARLERALINFMLDVHTREHGYTEALPPFVVNAASLRGTGQLPKFEVDLFKLEGAGYYLAPTAEVPVTNIHRDEILDAGALPISYAAYTPCFRSEAGSYGKDTRGMIRQHQFNKVELVKFTAPEDSWDALEALTGHAETILQRLELPYRVVTLCTGDLGFAAAKTYDLEVWLPGQQAYREISSCSNFTDFQARRANIRCKRGKKPEFVHTLNGSGLAVGRTLVAILENHQQPNGAIRIPEALVPYFGAPVIEAP